VQINQNAKNNNREGYEFLDTSPCDPGVVPQSPGNVSGDDPGNENGEDCGLERRANGAHADIVRLETVHVKSISLQLSCEGVGAVFCGVVPVHSYE
jgi:hypothetical protein